LKWLGKRFFTGFYYEQISIGGSPIISKIGFESPKPGSVRTMLQDQLRKKLKFGDPRLPISVCPGLANVVPYGTEITQVSSSNSLNGKNGFFLELEGCWYEKPPRDVVVLRADGNQSNGVFRRLTEDEQSIAIDLIREHWPYRQEILTKLEEAS